MPFPSNAADNASVAADRLIDLAARLRAEAVKYISQCDAAALNAHDLISAFAVGQLAPISALWATLRTRPGVAGAVRARYPNAFASDAEVTAALDAAQTAIDATLAYCVANTPKDASGWVLTLKVTNNAFEQRVVTAPAQLNPLKAQLVALRDAFSA